MSVAIILGFASPDSPIRTAHVFPAGAISVIDGDTVRLNGQSIRLLGLDTPETGWRARCEAERRRGRAAKAHLRNLLAASGIVRVELDGVGRFGRPLARLMIFGDFDVAHALIGAGLARPYWGQRLSWCGERTGR